LFSSDNGPQFGGEGDECTTRFNCQLHGAKGSVHEGGIRVPLLLRWPAVLQGGREINAMVHMADWFPTILAMAGLEVPCELRVDGVNVLPVIRGEANQGCTRRFWQWNRYTPEVSSNAAVRDGDWKLVHPAIAQTMAAPCVNPWLAISMYEPERLIGDGLLREPEPPRTIPAPPEPELYNIASDPLELSNLANEQPEIAHRLLCQLETWFEEVEAERRAIPDVW
jgi:arylsulfatase A